MQRLKLLLIEVSKINQKKIDLPSRPTQHSGTNFDWIHSHEILHLNIISSHFTPCTIWEQSHAPSPLGSNLMTMLQLEGDPLPSVYWYRNEKLIDDSDMKTFDETVKNRIVLRDFVRADLNARWDSSPGEEQFICIRYSYLNKIGKKILKFVILFTCWNFWLIISSLVLSCR